MIPALTLALFLASGDSLPEIPSHPTRALASNVLAKRPPRKLFWTTTLGLTGFATGFVLANGTIFDFWPLGLPLLGMALGNLIDDAPPSDHSPKPKVTDTTALVPLRDRNRWKGIPSKAETVWVKPTDPRSPDLQPLFAVESPKPHQRPFPLMGSLGIAGGLAAGYFLFTPTALAVNSMTSTGCDGLGCIGAINLGVLAGVVVIAVLPTLGGGFGSMLDQKYPVFMIGDTARNPKPQQPIVDTTRHPKPHRPSEPSRAWMRAHRPTSFKPDPTPALADTTNALDSTLTREVR